MSDTNLTARFRARAELALSRPLALVPTALNRLRIGPPLQIDGQTLNPDAQAFLRDGSLLGLDHPHPEIEVERERHARAGRLSHGRTIRVGTVEDRGVAGAAGELEASLYVPERAPATGPLLVYFHGGGFAVGGVATHDQLCRLLCREAAMRVLLVRYRLGPEHRFPAAHDDALASYVDVAAAPERFGGSAGSLAVGGDSAGANLALSVSRAVRATATPAPAFQALFYPVCDRTRERRSHELFGDGFYLTRERIAAWHAHYHGPGDAADQRLSPLLADDLGGLPRTHLLLAGFDPLRDEGLELAERLRAAGNEVELTLVPEMFHGFINAVGVGASFREPVGDFARSWR